ncbi:MAG TPA: hypothetical protein VLF93_07930 [Candidatus Saccharimonadales bacterium]|nr:hypothetical protein [Candidatus Saccharimonadales bacterium]
MEQNPPSSFIETRIAQAGTKAHDAYGFTTEGKGSPLIAFYNDKASAGTILVNFANLVNTEGPKTPFDLLETEQNDPLFHDLLSYAAEGLSLKSVRLDSIEYREVLGDFMRRYARSTEKTPEYLSDCEILDEVLERLLKQSVTEIKEHIDNQAIAHYPSQTLVLDRLSEITGMELFGNPEVQIIDPVQRNIDKSAES